jgi:hypothetical protein
VWGLVRSARIELPHIRLVCMDVAGTSSTTEAAARLLGRELAAAEGVEVVYRDGVRHTPKLALERPADASLLAAESPHADGRGCALITGGLG